MNNLHQLTSSTENISLTLSKYRKPRVDAMSGRVWAKRM